MKENGALAGIARSVEDAIDIKLIREKMNTNEFNEIIDKILMKCTDVLINKAKEYATQDKLHNFKVAAELQGISPKASTNGNDGKTYCIGLQICVRSGEYPLEMWDEKNWG